MEGIEILKNNIIERILSSRNEKLLEAINSILDSTTSNDTIPLSKDQVEMLSMSDNDIENGDFMSQEELDKLDSEWLS